MASAIEYVLIAAGISLSVIAVVNGVGSNNIERMFGIDDVTKSEKFMATECAKPRPDGGRREIVFVGDKPWFKSNRRLEMGVWATCPQ